MGDESKLLSIKGVTLFCQSDAERVLAGSRSGADNRADFSVLGTARADRGGRATRGSAGLDTRRRSSRDFCSSGCCKKGARCRWAISRPRSTRSTTKPSAGVVRLEEPLDLVGELDSSQVNSRIKQGEQMVVMNAQDGRVGLEKSSHAKHLNEIKRLKDRAVEPYSTTKSKQKTRKPKEGGKPWANR